MLKKIEFVTRTEVDNIGGLPGRTCSTGTLTVEMVGTPGEMAEMNRLYGVDRQQFWSVVIGETEKARPKLVGGHHPELMRAIQALGIDIDSCQKVVIEIGLREPVAVYAQLLGNTSVIGVVKALDGGIEVEVEEQ